MNIILLGPPGSGKGTLSAMIKKEYNLTHISTGDLFREHMAKNTPTGIIAKSYIDKGNLVPDEFTNKMLKDKIDSLKDTNGIILDGYPRTIGQAEMLPQILKIDKVFYFEVSESEIIERILGRLTCADCGHISHRKWVSNNICPLCKGTLTNRTDDTETAIKQRLINFYNMTSPLIEYYKSKKLLYNIDASGGSEKAFEQIKRLI